MSFTINSNTVVVSLIEGTCSYRASLYFCKQHGIHQQNIKQVNSFFEGKAYLSSQHVENQIMLIPHVHELALSLTMHSDFQLLNKYVFNLMNPELVLARSNTALPLYENRCATIKTLRTLLVNDDSQYPIYFFDTHNTQEAAYSSAIGECGYCITNENGLNKYSKELTLIRNLKRFKVFWFPFFTI